MHKIDFHNRIIELCELTQALKLNDILHSKPDQGIKNTVLLDWAINSRDGYILASNDQALIPFVNVFKFKDYYETGLYSTLVATLNAPSKYGVADIKKMKPLMDFIELNKLLMTSYNLVSSVLFDPKQIADTALISDQSYSQDFSNIIIQMPYNQCDLESLTIIFNNIKEVGDYIVQISSKIDNKKYSNSDIVINYLETGSPLQFNFKFKNLNIGKYFFKFLSDLFMIKDKRESIKLDNLEKKTELFARINDLAEQKKLGPEETLILKKEAGICAKKIERLKLYPKGLVDQSENPDFNTALPPHPKELPEKSNPDKSKN